MDKHLMMTNKSKYQSGQLMISCDWGTSSFRLRLVEIESRFVIKETSSNDGMAKLYHQWQTAYQKEKINRTDFYIAHFYYKLHLFIEGIPVRLGDIPIVISGMACSSIGIKELPYATTPFRINGGDAIMQRMKNDDFNLNIYLISGVSSEQDVMRGEETQLVGLSAIEPDMQSMDSYTCIFPGTHSKHINIKDREIVNFNTFMTGELFDILIHHSILKDSVSTGNMDNFFCEADKEAYYEGIRQSGKSNLLHTLFSVRINKLFEYLNKNSNYFYLSGLLIGSELRSLALDSDHEFPIYLCSSNNVYSLYREAISELGLSHRTTFVSPDIMDKAIIEGHIKLMIASQNNK